ncbi:MAG: hypothetical protein M1378_02620 [Bacteroidetes bacterium]|nr:hypothetical protein [Bacteroidota bacterium]
MTAPTKSLSVFHFFTGLLVGFLIGASISREWATIFSRIVGAAVILAVAFFWRRIESYTHKRYVEAWSVRRSRGKWRFVITQYVVIRGGLLFAVFAGPMFTQPPTTGETLAFIVFSLVAFLALMVFLGSESWSQCEREYEVQLLRGAAQRIRTASN